MPTCMPGFTGVTDETANDKATDLSSTGVLICICELEDFTANQYTG